MSTCFGREWSFGGSFLVLAAGLAACAASGPLGATNADLARAHDNASQGAVLFAQGCAHCHGERGEGLAGASAILGPGALPEYPRDNSGPGSATPTDPQQLQIQVQTRPAGAPWRDPFRNAQSLFEFVSGHMPKTETVALKPDDYWAIVTFIISAQGGQIPQGGINAGNATSTPIPRP
jgi:hypothetical protein